MALSAEERKQINRKNASRSTGPKTKEGKEKARQNALKHGLRAEALALPIEDVEELRELTDDWLDYYQPASPGMRAMLDRAVFATVQSRRCERFYAAAASEQVRQAEETWDRDQEREFERLKKLLRVDPAEAMLDLKRSARGCRWVLAQWGFLLDTLERDGCWTASQRDSASRLLGERPEPDTLKDNPLAFEVRYYNLFARANPSRDAVAWIMDPKRIPDWLARIIDGTWEPDVAMSRQTLRDLVEPEVAEVTAREEALRTGIEEPGRSEAKERALMLVGEAGALYARYARMHDAAFHRAFKGLLNGEPVTDEEEEAPARRFGVDPGPGNPRVGGPHGGWMSPEDYTAWLRHDREVATVDVTAARPGPLNEANPIPTLEAAPPVAGGQNDPYAKLDEATVDASAGRECVAGTVIDLGGSQMPPR